MKKLVIVLSILALATVGYAKKHHHYQKNGFVRTTVDETGNVVKTTGRAAGDVVEGAGKATSDILQSF